MSFWTCTPSGSSLEKVRADGLGHVHDLREPVVVVGRLDLQRVEVAGGLRRARDDRETESAANSCRGPSIGGIRAAYDRSSVSALTMSKSASADVRRQETQPPSSK